MPVCPKCNAVYEDEANFCRTDGVPLVALAGETHLPLEVLVNESLRVVERLRTDRLGVVYRVDDEINPGQSYQLRLFGRGLVNSRVHAALGELASLLAERLNDPDVLAGYIPIQLEDGRYALLCDDHPGATLDEVIQREAPLTPALAVSTVLRIADVLSPAHAAGLVHGNVTPETVLVTGRGERSLAVKLLDFGVLSTIRAHNARALAHRAAPAGYRDYTNYAAPELVTGRGAPPDERTEIYALGALCYQMLSGWIPFSEGAIEGDAAVYSTEDPRPLVMLNGALGIPHSLERTVLRAMALNPDDRHGSLAELIESLQEIELDLSIRPQGAAAEPERGAPPARDASHPDEEPDVSTRSRR